MQFLHSSFVLPDTATTAAGGLNGGPGVSADEQSSADAAEPPDEGNIPSRPRTPLALLGLASRRRPSLASLRCRYSHSKSNSSNILPTLATLFQTSPSQLAVQPPQLALQLALPPPLMTGKRPRSTTPPLPLQGILTPSLPVLALGDAPPKAPGLERADSVSSSGSGSRPRKVVRFASADPEVEGTKEEFVEATNVWMTYSSEVYDRSPIEPTCNSLSLPAREGGCSWIRCFEREKAKNASRLKALKAGLCSGTKVSPLALLPRVDTANARATPIAALSAVTAADVAVKGSESAKDFGQFITAVVLPVSSGESRTPSPGGSMNSDDGKSLVVTPHPLGHWLPPSPPASESDMGDVIVISPPHAVGAIWTEEPVSMDEFGREGDEEDEVVDVDVDEEEGEDGAEIQVDEDEEEEAQDEAETEEAAQVEEEPVVEDMIVAYDVSTIDDAVPLHEEHTPKKPSPRSSPGVSPRTSPLLAATVLGNVPEPLCVDGVVANKEKKKKNGMCALGKFSRDELFSNCDVLSGF